MTAGHLAIAVTAAIALTLCPGIPLVQLARFWRLRRILQRTSR